MASILLVDDEQSFLQSTSEILSLHEHTVVTADCIGSASQIIAEREFDVLLVDLMLPDGSGLELLEKFGDKRPRQVIVITGQPGIKNVIQDLHGPGLDYLIKPLDLSELLQLVERGTKREEDGSTAMLHSGLLVGESSVMLRVYEQIKQVSLTDTTVLITGESGTGKELVAEAIHLQSRRTGEFVPVNCGALTSELLASELFGHEKGSFTGANKRHIGVFERAEQGTLFLDEITEMPIEQQPHLLRALESNRITRVGAEKETAFNSRVVTASNRNLAEAIEDGALREDLYFRLSIFPINLPPLRERKGDISLLAALFLDKLNERYSTSKSLSSQSLAYLEAWHWPGNVRELKHIIHRYYISSPEADAQIDLPERFAMDMSTNRGDALLPGRSIQEVEKELILNTLEHCNGDKPAAAEMLGVSLKTLYNRLASYEQ